MVMQSMNSDVIGVQELRFDRNYYGTGKAQNAMIQLANLMPSYPYFMWQPNMVYSADVMEGVGIFSKYPITYTDHVLIGSSQEDPNIRGVICSVISHPQQIFNFYVTHVSYVSQNQLPQAKRIWDFIVKTYRYPYVVVADWNCDIEDGMDFLTGKKDYEGERGNLTDWAESTGQPTFPSNDPSKRIDRILTSKEWTCKGVTRVVGKSESEDLEASDHCAFYGEYYISQSQYSYRKFIILAYSIIIYYLITQKQAFQQLLFNKSYYSQYQVNITFISSILLFSQYTLNRYLIQFQQQIHQIQIKMMELLLLV